jgi:hypothetical protein
MHDLPGTDRHPGAATLALPGDPVDHDITVPAGS